MTTDRFFELFTLVALMALLGLGAVRLLALRARGVGVLAADRQRPVTQILFDVIELVALLVLFYDVLAFSLPLPDELVPPILERVVVHVLALRVAGAAVLVASVVIYLLALRAFGDSWRIGIDREHPGPLVTGGIFAWSRNPVYVSLNLLAVGAFLTLGGAAFLVLAPVIAIFFDLLIRREERFLAATYGDAYREYRARVGRYLGRGL